MSGGCKIETLDDLREAVIRLGLDIPVSEDISVLAGGVEVAGRIVPNRFCVQPMECHDAMPDGSPGELTRERYCGYARGGSGLIWVEAVAVSSDGRSGPNQLYLNSENVQKFGELVRDVRAAAGQDIVLVLQLSHAGQYSVPVPVSARDVGDAYLDSLRHAYLDAARLAAEAGFDGVDIKSCHKDFVCELLNITDRPGVYGGGYEGRSRFIRETVAGIIDEVPGIFVTTRLGVKGGNDIDEKIRLVGDLREMGVPLVNISIECAFAESGVGRWDEGLGSVACTGDDVLRMVADTIEITGLIQRAFPDMPVIGGGYGGLGVLIPQVAAGVIQSGAACFAGIGRGALAYPDLAGDVLKDGRMDSARCCISCSACMQVLRAGGNVGCVIRNHFYGVEYRRRRRFAARVLKDEAERCHDCVNAPCMQACPAGINIPGFIKAFGAGNIDEAYRIIRKKNIFPEMCSLLCPVTMICEGACVETALTGRAVVIADLQYAVSRAARGKGFTGVDVSCAVNGRNVAVVGAGPAGVSCAAGLLEKGYEVVIYEAGKQTGGTPEALMRGARFSGGRDEMEAVLLPALRAGRLEICYQRELGRNLGLGELREEYDAVVLASGLWSERSLGRAGGVVSAVDFLRDCRAGLREEVPDRVVLLSGGDCAIDVAVTVMELGAKELFIVYAGSMSEMHWHMDDAWFRTEGVHCLFLNQPVGYEFDESGNVSGVRIAGVDPAGERVLKAEMVIEAMGLGIAEEVKSELSGIAFTEYGLVKTEDDGLFATGLAGVFAVGGIINGGATVVQCISEGMRAVREVDNFCNVSVLKGH